MRILVTILAVLAVLAGLLLVGLYAGAFDVAADQPENSVVHWFLDTAQERGVASAADGIEAPSLTDPGRIETGGHHFRAMCEGCHGAPGVERSEIGKGLSPEPPELSHAVREWTPAEMFWVVKHGIRMTGMPAFGETHTDDDIWSIVAFVRQLPEMSPERYSDHGEAGAEGDHHAETGSSEEEGDHAHEEGAHSHG